MYKDHKYFKNKKIIVTGHTGFKGSWLTLWLYSLGAEVLGLSKDVPTNLHTLKFKIRKKLNQKNKLN